MWQVLIAIDDVMLDAGRANATDLSGHGLVSLDQIYTAFITMVTETASCALSSARPPYLSIFVLLLNLYRFQRQHNDTISVLRSGRFGASSSSKVTFKRGWQQNKKLPINIGAAPKIYR